MLRKLISTMLCAFALLLLMGAGAVPQQTVAILAEEESAVLDSALETETQSVDKVSSQGIHAAAGVSPLELAEDTECNLLIDGVYAPASISMTQQDGVTYVALAAAAQTLDSAAQVSWDAASGVVTVTTAKLNLTAQTGQHYMVANGRYIYLQDKVQLSDGRVMVPLWAVAKVFDAQVSWDAQTGVVSVTRGTGVLESAETYYDQEDLFWLSRIIYAESGNQPLKGQMAVGNVVMNRVASPIFPDTVQGVLAQKNQFSPYKGGRLANRTPNASSVIAAKLVLDGGVVEETEGALYFDSTARSWASRNKECIAVIGNHYFYR